MSRFFYIRMALTNLKKNRQTYFPYLLTCILTICMFFIFQVLAHNDGLNHMGGGKDMATILGTGSYIIAIFAVIFLYYTNSFLIKQRKKELGLYCILGLEKKHVARILTWESIMTYLACMILGIISGFVLGKLVFLVLIKLVHINVSLSFGLAPEALLSSMTLFLCIFVLNLVTNIFHVRMVNPIELLRGGNKGEKIPKVSWWLALVGVACLGTGYYIAIVTQNPMDAFAKFFLAVILVIVGTYALFTAGSIALLRILKNNKKFFYKPKNFIAVSGMVYRMKQNAVGLANICILSTMVLVMIAGSVSLYISQEKTIRYRFPHDLQVNKLESEEQIAGIDRILEEMTADSAVSAAGEFYFAYLDIYAYNEGGKYGKADEGKYGNYVTEDTDLLTSFTMIPVEDYNRIEQKQVSLKEDEVLVFSVKDSIKGNVLQIGDEEFRIQEKLETSILGKKDPYAMFNENFLIVKNEEAGDRIFRASGMEPDAYGWNFQWNCDIDGKKDDCVDFSYAFIDRVHNEVSSSYVDSMYTSLSGWYMSYGGILFIGIFLGILFIMAAVLIIYYKQVSEGYEDHERFLIMQKVGMSHDEVRSSIRKQVSMVFFLPLVMAVIHVMFAFPMISRLLVMFNLTDIRLEFICTCVTVVVFSLVYSLVYMRTAKVYYRLVR
ncbi:ABC transporter permease [Diplocloster modestus]|uniref:ABC transporter permease n=1 Tax=Diplocloster modestus TaxID=2850322 RepID=A0ABS6K9A3_9FIRM|nr:ABC transporter permease [Diplocloster modestus]MBU9727061.1 ABC transporter permease [Diplocloster modestus]